MGIPLWIVVLDPLDIIGCKLNHGGMDLLEGGVSQEEARVKKVECDVIKDCFLHEGMIDIRLSKASSVES